MSHYYCGEAGLELRERIEAVIKCAPVLDIRENLAQFHRYELDPNPHSAATGSGVVRVSRTGYSFETEFEILLAR